MSRYVTLRCPVMTLPQLHARLEELGVPHRRAGRRRLMLTGSLECSGEPVDVRCEPGIKGAVEDFGFVVHDGQLRLVCGEIDRALLESDLLQPLRQAVAQQGVIRAAAAAGLKVERVTTDARGRRRIILKGR